MWLSRFKFIGLLGLLLLATLIASGLFNSTPVNAEKPANEPALANLHGGHGLSYNRDIRPILAENCFACHGPDSASRKADLRIDKRDAAVEMKAFVPGKPDESEAVKRIFSTDADELMPPAESHKKLTPEQKETIKKWIAQGAAYEPHWSYIAPKRAELPKVKNDEWVRNPIDAFILQKLEDQGLTPSPEADRRTLARRLSLDLRGLPPEPAEVEAFVNDTSADYYEKYVDKLMATPQWGEHRARYWLDYARYADSHGYHYDAHREMWAFRDWLINALNDNIRFDQFTLDTLAGDLIPDHTLDQQVASGFHRCALSSNETGLIDEEYTTLYTRDRTETTAQIWLGLTMNCSVCHDHKFDPIAQKEFYQMSAFFNNIVQRGNDGGGRIIAPSIAVPKLEDRERWNEVQAKLAEKRQEINSYKTASQQDYVAWLETAKPEELIEKIPHDKLQLLAGLSEGKNRTLHYQLNGEAKEMTLKDGFDWVKGNITKSALIVQPGESISVADAGDFDTNQTFSYGAWVKTPFRRITSAILAHMTEEDNFRGWDLWLEEDRIVAHFISKWDNNAIRVITKDTTRMNKWNHFFVTYDGSGKATGVNIYINGVLQQTETTHDQLRGSIKTTVPFTVGHRNNSSRIDDLNIEDVRIYSRALNANEVDVVSKAHRLSNVIASTKKKQTLQKNAELKDFWLANYNEKYQQLNSDLSQLKSEENKILSAGTIAYVMQERKGPPQAYILKRGEYDKRLDQVTAATPASLPPFPQEFPLNRLGLAKWLLLPEHPLTARVTVNRFWQELFGTGIVRTTGDLGLSGELPSHPELLDWLAVEFRESGWDIKKFYKLMVTSAAYRQSSDVTPAILQKDPANRLLSRGPRFRMDAEMVRDYMLSASGLLVKKIGGPSVKPYQPAGVWEAVTIPESNTFAYKQDHGDSLYRRSMYTYWKRAAPPAEMEIFNGPNRDTCTVRRDRTNTPLQALATLNDPQFIEAARVMAQTALHDSEKTTEQQIEFFVQRLLCRPFTSQEMEVAKYSIDELKKYYQEHADDAEKLIKVGEKKADPRIPANELAAWTMLVNQLMNLDEVLNK